MFLGTELLSESCSLYLRILCSGSETFTGATRPAVCQCKGFILAHVPHPAGLQPSALDVANAVTLQSATGHPPVPYCCSRWGCVPGLKALCCSIKGRGDPLIYCAAF